MCLIGSTRNHVITVHSNNNNIIFWKRNGTSFFLASCWALFVYIINSSAICTCLNNGLLLGYYTKAWSSAYCVIIVSEWREREIFIRNTLLSVWLVSESHSELDRDSIFISSESECDVVDPNTWSQSSSLMKGSQRMTQYLMIHLPLACSWLISSLAFLPPEWDSFISRKVGERWTLYKEVREGCSL